MPEKPTFTIYKQADYLNIRCVEHPEEHSRLEYVEDDGPVPMLTIECPKCGKIGPLKCGQFWMSNDLKNGLIALGESKHLPKC